MTAKGPSIPLDIGALQPPGSSGIEVLLAAGRAGALPILDGSGGTSPHVEREMFERSLTELLARFGSHLGIRIDEASAERILEMLASRLDDQARLALLIIAGTPADLPRLVTAFRPRADRVFREVVSRAEALEAVEAGADGVVAKGNESGGRVGSETTFVLLQRLRRELTLPVWAQGGIGPHAMGACRVAGATGVLLDSQFALAEESSVSDPVRTLIAAMDGGETVSVGESLAHGVRVHRVRGAAHLRALREMELMGTDRDAFAARLTAAAASSDGDALLPIGQEAAFAGPLAARYRSVGGIVRAYRRQAVDNLRLAADMRPLAEGSPLARAHGTRFPIVQGPMTRVSDVAAFARSVADGGALPFLALALLRERETERLLREAAEALGPRPWGVGILGFVPPEIRAEQLGAVLKIRPPFALLAGGRPDQADALRTHGITTYLHAPSVRLLEMFLQEGARHFVLEGRECGGHVGPLSSLMLWQSALDVLLEFRRTHPREELSVLFAGGIHDAASAAMVSTLAAPAVAAGIRIGVLMGTAYLFTREAVADGAIVPAFQEEALRCGETVLLEMEGGHAIRCAPSAYAGEFAERRRALRHSGVPVEEARAMLEQMNLGRLRIASKGVARRADNGTSTLTAVSPAQQAQEGMYMIGQVAGLRSEVQTIAALHEDVAEGSARLLRDVGVQSLPAAPARTDRASTPVAIIGMAALFPGASDVHRFWSNILGRRDAIREVPPERWRADLFFHPDPQMPDRFASRWGGFLDPIPFDPISYGIPPASVRSIEPMQLLMLDVARRALADAGYDRRPFDRERAGVVIGTGGGSNDLALAYQTRAMVEHYLDRLPGVDPQARDQVIDAFKRALPELTEDSFPGVLPNVAAGRVANRFNLGGPNLTVDAACASSLAALEVAVNELRDGACDMVLVGAADTQMSPFSFLMFSKTHALSPTGRCRPFDAGADGITISEGVAVVVLRRLEDAVADGDRIYAVLRGVAGASDGRDKSLTAPSTGGQQRALTRAYAAAGISAATLGVVEAHGTGTVVGDRTELQTLRTVFDAAGAAAQTCALGSVKSQIGHTKNAAGLAGLIKTTLALHHRILPPTLVERPSDAMQDDTLPFYLNARARPWLQVDGIPRRGAVSAFGFGGTNFHAVLEEFPGHAAAPTERPAELFLFRAPSRGALATEVERLLRAVDGVQPEAQHSHVVDLALAVNRRLDAARGECRLAIVAADTTELKSRAAEALDRLGRATAAGGPAVFFRETPGDDAAATVAFLFPGQGSQALHMLQDLAVYFPIVREAFQQAEQLLTGILPVRLSDVVFPPQAHSPEEETAQRRTLNQTWYAQPALAAADYALFSLLASLGIRPALVGGHSFGEYVALCAAGAFGFAELIAVAEARGRAVQETQGRDAVGMLAVRAPAEAVQEWIGTDHPVHVAGANAPAQTIVGGAREAIEAFTRDLERRGVLYQRLPMSAGFHIPEARPAAERVAAVLERITIAAPQIPVYANGTARPYPAEAAEIRRLLTDQLTRPLRFQEQVEAMYEAGARIFVEVGPGQVLGGLVRQILQERPADVHQTSPASSSHPVADVLAVVGALFTAGAAVNWRALFVGREATTRADTPQRERLASTTWLVDGATATPLGDGTPPASRRMPAADAGDTTRTFSEPGHGEAPSPPHAGDPVVRGDGQAAHVLEAFHKTMRRFLEYQEQAQQRRQRLMERFLETHRAIMEAYATGTPLPREAFVLPSSIEDTPGLPAAGQDGAVQESRSPSHSSPPTDGKAPTVVERSPAELLLELVSERTGYPADMLDLDHNMEADLGIDSIKRTEIFAALRERLGLRADTYDQEEYFVAIAQLRTLREVLAWLEEQLVTGRRLLPPREAPAPATAAGNGHPPLPEEHTSTTDEAETVLRRFVVHPVAAALSADRREAREGEVILLTEDGRGIGSELSSALRAMGHSVIAVRHAAGAGAIDVASASAALDLLSPDAVEAFRRSVTDRYGRVTALCHVLPLDGLPSGEADSLEVKSLFLLARAFAQDLRASAGTLIAFTAMGGLLGRNPQGSFRSGQAAVTGLLKSAAREWPEVVVKAIDVDPGAGREYLAAQLLAEVSAADRTVESGYSGSGRVVLRPAETDLDRSHPRVHLDGDSVILATGGARGITAAVCAALAERWRPRLVLVGRSSLPGVEDPETAEVGAADVKRVLVERRRRRGQLITPSSVEEEYQAILRGREIRSSLARLHEAGAAVEYHSLDIRNAGALEDLVASLYRRFGRLDGVIHGAGVLRDGLLADKSVAGFEEVYDTKVTPALALERSLDPASLQFLAFFSSVSARFGNSGQADYAAANEVLNTLACRLDAEWLARVVSIGWGPWDGTGMLGRAGTELRRRHRRNGLLYHSVRAGCERFIDEILFGRKGEPEVLIFAPDGDALVG